MSLSVKIKGKIYKWSLIIILVIIVSMLICLIRLSITVTVSICWIIFFFLKIMSKIKPCLWKWISQNNVAMKQSLRKWISDKMLQPNKDCESWKINFHRLGFHFDIILQVFVFYTVYIFMSNYHNFDIIIFL
jgi:hypothetical protein